MLQLITSHRETSLSAGLVASLQSTSLFSRSTACSVPMLFATFSKPKRSARPEFRFHAICEVFKHVRNSASMLCYLRCFQAPSCPLPCYLRCFQAPHVRYHALCGVFERPDVRYHAICEVFKHVRNSASMLFARFSHVRNSASMLFAPRCPLPCYLRCFHAPRCPLPCYLRCFQTPSVSAAYYVCTTWRNALVISIKPT